MATVPAAFSGSRRRSRGDGGVEKRSIKVANDLFQTGPKRGHLEVVGVTVLSEATFSHGDTRAMWCTLSLFLLAVSPSSRTQVEGTTGELFGRS